MRKNLLVWKCVRFRNISTIQSKLVDRLNPKSIKSLKDEREKVLLVWKCVMFRIGTMLLHILCFIFLHAVLVEVRGSSAYASPYIFRVLSIDVDAINLELSPNRTPVAVAVWSLIVRSSFHCLHRYTLTSVPATAR